MAAPIRICLAGASGWVGRALSRALAGSEEFVMVAALGRSTAGRTVGDVVGIRGMDVPIDGELDLALRRGPDVFIDYTHPSVAKTHVLAAIEAGTPVVLGTSGLTQEDFDDVARIATKRGVGVLAAGNFALTAALLQHLAVRAATLLKTWEIIEYASESKPDAPSGTGRELAWKLSNSAKQMERNVRQTIGIPESRGATLHGAQIHAIRLPGFTFAFEVVFGASGERLTLRHDAGESAIPYVDGTLMAAKHVLGVVGLERGLEGVLESMWGQGE